MSSTENLRKLGSITLVDVAAQAGVSMKTVSRVVNGEPHVRPEIRERVMAAASALGYRPNLSARALAGSRSYLLGLYLNNPNRAYVSQVEYGAMRACRSAGYHLIVEEMAGTGEDILPRVEALHAAVRMDGVILTPPLSDDRTVLDELRARALPVVRIAPAPADPDFGPCVVMDDEQAAYEMTRRLQGFGHRRIAFIAGPESHAAASSRCDGYLRAMQEAGLAGEATVRPGDFDFRSGQRAGEDLLARDRPPTAIFAANDEMALGVMAMAHRRHLDVPKALSIAGFDDSPSAEVVWPRLSTVRQPVEEMAFQAAKMLIAARGSSERATAAVHKLDFEIIMRESVAAPGSTD